MTKLHVHDKYHTDPAWEYYCISRIVDNTPLRVWFNCAVCHSTLVEDLHTDFQNVNLVNREELEMDLKILGDCGEHKIHRIYPNRVLFK